MSGPSVELSFVPQLLRRRVAAGAAVDGSWQVARFTVVVFVDINGFSALAERMTQRGPDGVGGVGGLLERWSGMLVDRVHQWGGDVLTFAGDALVCAWMTDDDGDEATAVQRAAACALAMQRSLHGVEIADGVCLGLQIGLVTGTLGVGLVGGLDSRYLFYAVGPAISRLTVLGPSLVAGQVVVDADSWDLLRSSARGERASDGTYLLLDVVVPPPGRAEPAALSPAMLSELRGFIPDAVRSRIERGQPYGFAELQRVTTLFIDLSELGRSTSTERLQRAVRAIQEVAARFDGTVDKLALDEKGLTCVLVFGIPPRSHEDDAVRGVRAALAIAARLSAMGVRPGVGVASGRAWCVALGADTRREYAMIGDVPNLAARLMRHARGRTDDNTAPETGVACDETTARAAAYRVAFLRRSTVTLKGRPLPASVFQPTGDGRTGEWSARAPPMVGRIDERKALAARLDALAGGRGGLVMVGAGAGLGKTRLVVDLLDEAIRRGFPAFVGVADLVERSTPYFAWRAVFARMLGTEGRRDLAALRSEIAVRMGSDPARVKLLPLLDAVVRLDLDENTLTRQMAPLVRADNTHLLLAWLAGRVAAQMPFLVVLDDAQWLDSASWEVVRVMARDVPGVMVVLAHRPFDADAVTVGVQPPGWLVGEATATATGDAAFRPDVTQINLGPMCADEVRALVAQTLGSDTVPDDLCDLVVDVAKGHPLFSSELVLSLLEAGRIVVTGGACAVRGEGPLVDRSVSATLEGVIAARIDRLGAREQLTLKAASVVGRTFSARALQAVHPSRLSDDDLDEALDRLLVAELLTVEAPEPARTYAFRHGITQQVAYDAMVGAQREALHRATAEGLELEHSGDLAPMHSLLAWHWRRAGERGRALFHLERAGHDAVRRSANRDAIRFFEEARALATELGGVGIAREASWRRQIGEARFALGDLAGCRADMVDALTRLGQPKPAPGVALVGSVLWLMAVQAAYRWLPFLLREAEGDERQRLLDIVRAAERGTEVFYLNNQEIPAFWCAMVALNASDRVGPGGERVRAYASMALAAGVLGRHGLALSYRQLAIGADAEVGDLGSHTWMQGLLGTYAMGVGNWPDARARFSEAIGLHRRLGDWARWGNCVLPRAWVGLWEGDAAWARSEFAMVAAERRQSSVVYEAIALAGVAATELRLGGQGAPLRALSSVSQGFTALGSVKDRAAEILLFGLQALAASQEDDAAAVRTAVDAALLRIEGGSPLGSYLMEGYAATAEAAVWLAAREPGGPALAKRALAALRQFAGPFPVARARSEWLEAAGAGPRARRRRLEQALADAERLTMPWEVGLARLGLAELDAVGREAHLDGAQRAFARVGALDRQAGARALQERR